MTPPWRKEAKGSQAQRRVQNFNLIFVPSRARVKSLSPNSTTNLHQSDSDTKPCMRTEHKGCLSWPQATHHVEALARWTFPWTVSGLKKLGPKWIRRHKACRDRGFAMHFLAIYTIITRRKCALRHTSARCTQYLQDRGLLCDIPP